MRSILYTVITCMSMLCFAPAMAQTTFRDIKLNLMNGNLLTEDEIANKTTTSFGVTIDENGIATRVEQDDASADIVLQNFKFHSNEHGLNPGTFIVPVSGNVKISIGGCNYGGDVTIKDGQGNLVKTVSNIVDNCYHNGEEHVATAFYSGEATTLSVTGGKYIPYFAVETVNDVPATATISFDLGAYADAGIAPSNETVQLGENFTLPMNRTIYVENQTLANWTDGTNNYAPGSEITVNEDITLTPVFAANNVTLNDRNGEVTITWDFQRKNGAPVLKLEKSTGFLVTQATVNGEVIDVKADLDATNGKINNSNNTDWAQMNSGSILTFPAAKNCVVEFLGYKAPTTTTVAGSTNYTLTGNMATFLYGGSESTIDIVIGDGDYYRYFTITYPEVVSNLQERPVYTTDFTDWTDVATGGPVTVTKQTNFSNESFDFTFEQVGVQSQGTNTSKFGDLKGFAMAAKVAPGTITTTALSNITRVRYFHGATGSNRGYKLEKKSATDEDWVLLSDNPANPATGVWVESNINEENVQLRWTNINTAQNAYMFELEIYSKVEITAPQVNLQLAALPAEGGNVSASPESSEYDQGTTVVLTAKRNFGYKFVEWIDQNGNSLSTEESYSQALNEDMAITAIFTAIPTYELTATASGDGKDYMVALSPAPTMVSDKKMYEDGTLVTLTATENYVVKFTNWASGETTREISVTMDGEKNFDAVYSASDYIAGWDFYRRGSISRLADFASTPDNENSSLILRDAAGVTKGWLDKSQEAGGYEGEPGAVNWQPIADKLYYETKINATDFTDIKVYARMLYNYNAYETQTLEYSLDGVEYKEAGRVTIPGNKVWTPFEVTLPAECDHAPTLSLRWIPDYTSNIAGSPSENDGTAISSIYIMGTPVIYNDGKAPVLVSCLPANNTENISASGRIVLSFDKRVVLAENTVATLGDKTLQPTVAGKTITFPYMALNYNSNYTFTLPANCVADQSGNTLATAITINFKTVIPPTVTPGMYDEFVTTAEELLAAINKANNQVSTGERYRIFVHNGIYDLGSLTLTEVKSNISLIGESMDNTIIMNTPTSEGIGNTATLMPTGENIYMQDITLKNALDYFASVGAGRAVCLQDKGNKNVYKNIKMLSYQDTYYSNNNAMRSYFEDGRIHGTVDFICGGGDVFFNRTTIYLENRAGNVITAPAGTTDWGYVFNDCTIDGDELNKGSYALGRPWQGSPMNVWINTTMNILPKAEGWNEMSSLILPKLFAEYNSKDGNGTAVDCSLRKTTFYAGTVSYNPVLTAEEAAKFTVENVLSGDDSWQPTLLTEQAQAPAITISNGNINWDASNYVFCYAICKNGKVVDFTNSTTYSVPADTEDGDQFSVRAANAMGGLSAASNSVSVGGTGIENNTVEKEVMELQYFNTNGMRIQAQQQGLNIVRIIYTDGTSKTVKEFVK